MRIPVPDEVLPASALGRVHLVGIGGAGLSAIARLMHQQGVPVSGSDAGDSAVATATAGAFRGIRLVPNPAWWADHRAAAARRFEKRSAISSAVRTASAPFSKRGSAWSARSSVRTPNATGTPVSIAAS